MSRLCLSCTRDISKGCAFAVELTRPEYREVIRTGDCPHWVGKKVLHREAA